MGMGGCARPEVKCYAAFMLFISIDTCNYRQPNSIEEVRRVETEVYICVWLLDTYLGREGK